MMLGLRSLPTRELARRGLCWIGLSMCACYSSCDGSPSNAQTIGELGNGTFHYTCTGTGDPVCELGLLGQAFPDCIALGGSFELDYTLRDISEVDDDELLPFLFIESASQRFFAGSDVFTALRVGRAGFVARDNDVVVDILHLEIVAPEAMQVVALDPADPVDQVHMRVGDRAFYRVFPRTSECAQLGGAVPITADSSDDVIASAGIVDGLEIAAHGPGTATVTVTMGELTHEMTIIVDAPQRNKPEQPPTTGESSEGESGSDGTSSDSGDTSGGSGESDSSGSTGG